MRHGSSNPPPSAVMNVLEGWPSGLWRRTANAEDADEVSRRFESSTLRFNDVKMFFDK